MEYVALYRKWRPKGFSELVGQEHVSRTIAQAVVGGRVGHAYLFSGPRGTGKTSTAKILAKALNCEQGPTAEPCNECESCRRISDGSSMDVMEIDAASNRGIDEIRELRETVKFAPTTGRYKVYIIDEVHMLTSEAFNALLKTLEEPPPQVVFILATTELQKVPATIQSRCQRYDFKRIAAKDIEARLREIVEATGVAADEAALALIARQADGGLRDALSTLDQCISLAGARVTEPLVREILGLVGRESVVRILRALAAKDAKEALSAAGEVLAEGKDAKQLVAELVAELRSAMVYQAAGLPEGAELYETDEGVLQETAALFPPEAFLPMLRALHDVLTELRWTTEPRIAVETALLSICREGGAPTVPARRVEPSPSGGIASGGAGEEKLRVLAARIEALEKKIASGAVSVAPAGTTPTRRSGLGAKKTAAAAKRSTKKAAVPTEAFVKTEEGEALWSRLLAALKEAGEWGVLACLGKSVFGGMTENFFCIWFGRDVESFSVENLEEGNFRRVVEEYLERLSGKPLRIVAEVEKPQEGPKKEKREAEPPREKTTMEVFDSLPPEHQSLMKPLLDTYGEDSKIMVMEEPDDGETLDGADPSGND
ncbi:MAG: DNA polymerase III subunit gamma/tau [Schwartzia sp.]|nr:DNA polymerase III subunit gamma/tau [Schwartzia sp. (in: firmicutes)]